MSRDRILCTCFEVPRSDVAQAIAAGEGLDAIQARFGCGRDCGSCLPELRVMLCLRTAPRRGYLVGGVLAGLGLAVLLTPRFERLVALGPANPGHRELRCDECHGDAPGTVRQQLQANVRHLLGKREEPVDLVHTPVSSGTCGHCHQRPGDRHPLFRFRESRFEELRETLAPHRCTSCHREHQGARVAVERTFCHNCHKEFELERDPLSPSHDSLAAQGRYETCLECHDFHGNHRYQVPVDLGQRLDDRAVDAYMERGPSPYGDDKRWPARLGRTQGEGRGS